MLSDCRHPRVRNFNFTIPVDVLWQRENSTNKVHAVNMKQQKSLLGPLGECPSWRGFRLIIESKTLKRQGPLFYCRRPCMGVFYYTYLAGCHGKYTSDGSMQCRIQNWCSCSWTNGAFNVAWSFLHFRFHPRKSKVNAMVLRIRSSSIMAWNSSRLLSPPKFFPSRKPPFWITPGQKRMKNHAQLTVRRKKCFGGRSVEVDVGKNDCPMWRYWFWIWTYLVCHALTTHRLVSLDTETWHYTLLLLFLRWP